MKFCPQPSRVIRDHARCSLLVSGSSQFLRDTISVFSALAFVSRISRLRCDPQGFWKNTCALFSSLVYVIIKNVNEGSRSGAKG